MTGNDFLEKMEMLDADLVEAADEMPVKPARNVLWKCCAAAACVCLLGGAVLVSAWVGIKPEERPSGDLLVQGSEFATDNQQDGTQEITPNTQQIVTGTEEEPSSETEEPVILANASYLTFDINPSFQLTIDEGIVVDYLAINDDGEDILKNIEVIGKKVEDALPLVIGELVEQGYLAKKDYAPVMLLSARGGDEASQLLEEAVFISQDALVEKEVEVFIVAQQIENPDELEVLAEKYGVSVGKMQYVLNILREESNLSVEDATAYTVIELFGMDIEKRLIEPPYKVGDYDEYGEKVLFVGSVESYVGYVPWDKLPEEYKKELEAMYTPEALEILAKPRVWTTMPGAVGLPADEALELLYSRNLAPMICYEDNPNARIAGYKDGMVFKQDIPQGTRWASDSCVHIWILVSENSPEQQVPIEEDVNWGVSMQLENVTPTSATVVFERWTGTERIDLTRSHWYVIERWTGEEWEPLELLSQDVKWNTDGMVMSNNSTIEVEESWEQLYGQLPNGKYRMGKLITDSIPGDYICKVFYAEFEIAE